MSSITITYKCTNIDGVRHAWICKDSDKSETRLCDSREADLSGTQISAHALGRGDTFCKKCGKAVEKAKATFPAKDLRIIKHPLPGKNTESGVI